MSEDSRADLLTGENVVKAHEIVRQAAHDTPVVTCSALNRMSGHELFFKCENFQKIGAFKFRGAFHAATRLLSDNPDTTSFCTHSSGNHAQAVALASTMANIPSHIVMPENAFACKVAAVKEYNGIVHFAAAEPLARERLCTSVMSEHGSTFIHPSNEPYVILGAGTACLELMQSVTDLDAVIVPIGGGGLASGTALAAKHLSHGRCKVFGAEPMNADDAYQSFQAKRLIVNDPAKGRPKTIADGLLTNLGTNTYRIISTLFDDIFRVEDDMILKAMVLVWERMKIVIEPSSAVPVAAILFNERFKAVAGECGRIGVILSGGNIEMSEFFKILEGRLNQ